MNLPDLSLMYKILNWHNESEHDKSVGLFIPVPQELSQQFPEDGRQGQDNSPVHITLLYIGQVPEHLETKLIGIIKNVCDNVRPFPVKFAKIRKFINDKRQEIYHVPVKSNRLMMLHNALKNELQRNQIPVDTTYNEYKPHVTLEYVNEGEKPKYKKLKIEGEFLVESVWLWSTRQPHMFYLNK